MLRTAWKRGICGQPTYSDKLGKWLLVDEDDDDNEFLLLTYILIYQCSHVVIHSPGYSLTWLFTHMVIHSLARYVAGSDILVFKIILVLVFI